MIRLEPRTEQKVTWVILVTLTLITIGVLFFIIGFILNDGIRNINIEFLTGFPRHMGKEGGIFPMILGTFYLVLVAVAIATPLGVGSAVYLNEYAKPGRIVKGVRFGIDCLAGIPSIIFGLFGFVLFVVKLGFGWSILSGGLTLAFMILPTIIRTSEEAIKAVPFVYREVSKSLGAGKWQTIQKIVLPNALPGILTGIILGIGRSVGETACVIFTAGSSLQMPTSL
ncbi:MAG: phosphate ABC transporter permease PstA, partial [candidate division WOR-3 bacterium]